MNKLINKLSDNFRAFSLFRNKSFSSSITRISMAVFDGILVAGVGLLFYVGYVGWDEEYNLAYFYIVSFFSALMIVIFILSGLYEVEPVPHPIQQIKKIISVNTLLFLSIIVLFFSLKISSEFSRVWLFSWYAIATVLLCFERTFFYLFLRKNAKAGRLTRNAVIFGANGQAINIKERVETQEYPWIRIVGRFDDRSGRIPLEISDQTVLGDINSLIQFIREHRCEEVLIALPWSAEKRIKEIIRKIRILPVTIRMVPEAIGAEYSQYSYDVFCGIPLLTLQSKPMLDGDYLKKIIEDRLLALFFMILIAPVFLVVAILIKLDSPGPIFFRQKRYGFNNKLIKVYKFRSLHVAQQDKNAEKLVTKNDPRITRVGGFIRRTSLDELPQFINVLKGEMSIVGPRPHALKASAAGELYDEAVSEYAARHKVKPGITGWAQVNGWRGETDTKEKIIKRVEFDMYYIENWSLALDIQIILRTPFALLLQKNAY